MPVSCFIPFRPLSFSLYRSKDTATTQRIFSLTDLWRIKTQTSRTVLPRATLLLLRRDICLTNPNGQFCGFTAQSDNVVLADERNRLAAEVPALENKKAQLQEEPKRRRRSGDTELKTCAVGSMKFLPTEEQCGMCEIRIDGKVLGDDDLKALHTSKTFTRIDISSCSGVCDVRLLAGLKQLQELHLGVDGEIENINLLSQLSELRKLSLINTNIQDSDVRCLGLIQKLEGLSLRSCSRVTSCQCIGQLPLLRVLDLSFTGVTDEELLGLSTSCSLVKIGLWDCSDLTDVSPLASIETLEVVDLDGCEGVKTVGALGRLPVLRELDLSCSVITDRELRGISASRSLVRIEVKIWRGLPDVSPLASIKTLKEVVLFACESVSGVLVCIRSLSIDEFREGILRRR